MECFYLIDPHARNCFGMPDPNGICLKLDVNLRHHMCVHDVLGMKDLTQIEEMLIACAL
jgi:hypothetical protein